MSLTDKPACLRGRSAEVSRLAPALCFLSEHAAKTSIKLPETLGFPPRLHNGDREGSQLIEVTMLFEGVFLGLQLANRVL